jgi:UDP-N-acetylglucosamine--N-acetylmuramyl-(pentapeptide) pyrophosphoryl-undecaprenol N-acetylglucosamine transferase
MTEISATSMSRGASRAGLRICLAASGGGHVRQLLDLEPAWGEHDAFFITEDTALGRSLAAKRRTYFIAHVALGQARLGSPIRMAAAAVRNLRRSACAIFRERPDVVLTTGAGAAFFTVLLGRLTGAKVILVESFARFDRPSMFARIAAPLAHHKIVQSKALAGVWPDAKVFDPLRVLDTPRKPKQPLLFATVGATLAFDRLVDSVAELKKSGQIPERVVMQTGVGGLRPDGVESHETLPFEEMQDILREADIVVCHGGTGSLITALREGCRVVAMPRLFERGEHYDDHQAEITAAFAQRGLIAVANSPEELADALELVRNRPPMIATTEPTALISYLRTLLAGWTGRKRANAAEVRQRGLFDRA